MVATHGNPEVEPLGFWFSASNEQLDQPSEEYGSSTSIESFVRKNVHSISSVELVELVEVARVLVAIPGPQHFAQGCRVVPAMLCL